MRSSLILLLVVTALSCAGSKLEPTGSVTEEYTRADGQTVHCTKPRPDVLTNEVNARLEAMRHFLHSLDYPDKDHSLVFAPDPLIVGHASQVIHGADHILGASLHPEHRRKGK